MRLAIGKLGFVSSLAKLGRPSYVPWNAGKAIGQKKAFSVEEARRLKSTLRSRRMTRDLALASLAFDSCLRSCDLLSLRWSDIEGARGTIRDQTTLRQRKTGRNVTIELSGGTKHVLREFRTICEAGDYLFPGALPSKHLSGRQYRRLVKNWAELLGVEPEIYGTHSLRRTRPAAVYAKTGDVEVARILLGQSSLGATHRYLGLDESNAFELARVVQF